MTTKTQVRNQDLGLDHECSIISDHANSQNQCTRKFRNTHTALQQELRGEGNEDLNHFQDRFHE
jgi:hypothetical protein